MQLMDKQNNPNALINELSPYLLQHAYNPVNWFPWHQKYLKKAEEDKKLLLISIGYASCHWCHVMEQECFKDDEVALLMNANFINLKIDREERPDLDQVYMNALQLISGQGGWPLNIVALPDGRPIWGGTYFPKKRWMEALNQLSLLASQKPEKLNEYARNLKKGLAAFEPNNKPSNSPILLKEIKQNMTVILSKKDSLNGGFIGAPKFIMPTLFNLFQKYSVLSQNKEVSEHLHFSLKKIALSGIFDTVQGGFFRYSVDAKWHIPHFEKMGYDNGQLLSIYAKAYKHKPSKTYAEVVSKTIRFLEEKLSSPEGGFYSSLDADSLDSKSNLIEGAYYVWTIEQIKTLFPKDFKLISAYYSLSQNGYWEKENYVFRRMHSDREFAKLYKINLNTLKTKVLHWNNVLLEERNKRKPPKLDDKIICSWNALITSGLLDAYNSFEEESYLILAKKNIAFIEKNLITSSGLLKRIFKNGVAKIDGFLEDYATTIKLYIDAYETIFDDHYLIQAQKLTENCIRLFKDSEQPLFYFSSSSDLIIRTKETIDNVIPSSNAVMAENLIRLSKHFVNPKYKDLAKNMIRTCASEINTYPKEYSYWINSTLLLLKPGYEVVAVGKNAKNDIKIIQKTLTVNYSWSAAKESNLPLFQGRSSKDKTTFYLCKDNQCQLPIESIEDVKNKLELLSKAYSEH